MSITNGPLLDDEAYKQLCEQFFFADDKDAGETLLALTSKASPEDNARLQAIQAKVRSRWHTHRSRERRKAYFDLLNKLPPSAKFNTAVAKKDLKGLISAHCTPDEPGTEPFFISLYAVIELQARSSWRRGAGPFRCEWEIDDVVWIEVGKTGFMESALEFVASSLACEAISSRDADIPSDTSTTPLSKPNDDISIKSPTDPEIEREYPLEKRTWIMPAQATNTQLRPLLRLFPRSIIAKVRKGSHGTGDIWIGERKRASNWPGPLYARIWYWYRYFILLGWFRWNTGLLVR